MNLLLLLLALTSVLADDTFPECACDIDSPPWFWNKASTARWMIRSIDWGILSTISTRLDANSQGPVPFGNVYSFVDGPCSNSTGTPYFYGTYMDQTFKDTHENVNAALTISAASLNSACLSASATHDTIKESACIIGSSGSWGWGDPELPVCARLTMTGNLVEVTDSVEKAWAQDALFARHKSMSGWPGDHTWIVAKLEVKDIWMLDMFGGATVLDLDDYFTSEASKKPQQDTGLRGVQLP